MRRALVVRLLVASVLVSGACSKEPREPFFPTFAATAPFEELHGAEYPPVVLEGEPLPAEGERFDTERAHRGVMVGAGLVSALPCGEGWRWGADEDLFVAVRRVPGPSASSSDSSTTTAPGEDLVLVVDHSSAMERATFEALRARAIALVETAPPTARVAVIAYALQADVRRNFTDASRRTELVELLRGLSQPAGERLAYGLNAVADLPIDPARSRRVVVLAGVDADVNGADRAASRLARDGTPFDILAFGGVGQLQGVAAAGRGTLAEGRAAGTAGPPACLDGSASASGPVDAWIVVERLTTTPYATRTVAQARFLADVDPELARVNSLSRAAGRTMAQMAGPELVLAGGAAALLGVKPPGSPSAPGTSTPVGTGGENAPAGVEGAVAEVSSAAVLAALTRTGGRGIGLKSRFDTWTGWRWIGANRHHVHLRMSRVIATRQPTDVATLVAIIGPSVARQVGLDSGPLAGALGAVRRGGVEGAARDVATGALREGAAAAGLPTPASQGVATGAERPTPGGAMTLHVGYATIGQEDDAGLGIALVCTSPTCSAARTFATFLAELRLPGGSARVAQSAEQPGELASQAGFVWLPAAVSGTVSQLRDAARGAADAAPSAVADAVAAQPATEAANVQSVAAAQAAAAASAVAQAASTVAPPTIPVPSLAAASNAPVGQAGRALPAPPRPRGVIPTTGRGPRRRPRWPAAASSPSPGLP
jgi:hypothetical protein